MKITKLYNEFQMQNTYFKIDLGCLRTQTWGDAGFQLHFKAVGVEAAGVALAAPIISATLSV